MSVVVPPSMFHIACELPTPRVEKPGCCPDVDPPTFTPLTMTPGTMLSTTQGSRAVGTASSTSRLKVAPVLTFFVSTTGAAPDTVTVSWTVDTSSLALISAENAVWMTIPSRFTMLNPDRLKVTV